MAIESIDLPRKVTRIFPKYLEDLRQNGIWEKTLSIYPQHLLAVTEEDPFHCARRAHRWRGSNGTCDKFVNTATAKFFKSDQGFHFGSLDFQGEPTINPTGRTAYTYADYLFLIYHWDNKTANFEGVTLWGQIASIFLNIEYDSRGTLTNSEINPTIKDTSVLETFVPPVIIDPQDILTQLFHPDTLYDPISAPPDLDYYWRSADILRIVGIRRISLAKPCKASPCSIAAYQTILRAPSPKISLIESWNCICLYF